MIQSEEGLETIAEFMQKGLNEKRLKPYEFLNMIQGGHKSNKIPITTLESFIKTHNIISQEHIVKYIPIMT